MNKLLLSLSAVLVASVTAFSAHAQEVKGDAKAGEKKVAMCIGCHGIVGYQASFPEIHKVPKISGQGAGYITAALNAYKKGERKHPSMRGIADSLSDQDIADLSAFYAASGSVEGAAPLGAALAATGKAAELIAKGNCASCHGDSFSKPIDPSYPKIAGQHSDYLFVALKAYKTEGNAQIGRSNGVMGGVAKQFSNAELKEMANYLGRLPTELKTVPESRFR
ncbi:c-type cytochrome [Rhodoferax saidenbachensis]|uniref:Cytochrome c4 n=1 Tax=Rhodoferax saidenbachensis TaxID=1484693 RepID=A0A1P8KDH3_9BURK|nr:c-type cytochrome [Rhodoferax saidenbachensis]APW44022.1 cytochrome c4 [Rhodoferax saidenbachensis]